jgi:peptidoglycan/xylan/chitin deacetylase (PgdA/CDA1 family)
MKRAFIILSLFAVVLSSCASARAAHLEETAVASAVQAQLDGLKTQAVLDRTPTITPTPTQTPTATVTPSPSPTLTPTVTPTWSRRGKGNPIYAPILLYHHIRDAEKPNRYDISPAVFERQLTFLKQWGYTSITVDMLANAIRYNDPLPEKPVIITFDDGDMDVYANAFPIMQRLGFVGTFYIVANRLSAADFVTTDQLKTMAAAGWEIGDHSYSHIDLTQNHEAISREASYSKQVLSDALGVPINSFAYPFGGFDNTVGSHVSSYGYSDAVGLGISYTHGINSIFYLSRLEVRNEYDDIAFAKLLPWSPVSTPPAP